MIILVFGLRIRVLFVDWGPGNIGIHLLSRVHAILFIQRLAMLSREYIVDSNSLSALVATLPVDSVSTVHFQEDMLTPSKWNV